MRTTKAMENTDLERKEICEIEIYKSGGVIPNPIDVLIITALREELCAVLQIGFERSSNSCGITEIDQAEHHWIEYRDDSNLPYYSREFLHINGTRFRVVVAEANQMGIAPAASRASALVREFNPRCLAMTGICAGRKGKTQLGDVIVADRVFQYDFGQSNNVRNRKTDEILHDITTYNLVPEWYFCVEEAAESEWFRKITANRHPTIDHQVWETLMELLDGKKQPKEFLHFPKNYPDWQTVFDYLLNNELITHKDCGMGLTDKGLETASMYSIRFPQKFPSAKTKLHLAPMATGNCVIKDPKFFEDIESIERKTLGVEMEASSIGCVANAERVPYMIVVKGVSDHGDQHKNDVFRRIAAKNAAKFLLCFLCQHLPPRLTEVITSSDPIKARIERTVRIVTALKSAIKKGKDSVRTIATFTSLAIDDKEPHPRGAYIESLMEERDELWRLIRSGFRFRCIVHPGRFSYRDDPISFSESEQKKTLETKNVKLKENTQWRG
jgi:nucleoside phosphorylase